MLMVSQEDFISDISSVLNLAISSLAYVDHSPFPTTILQGYDCTGWPYCEVERKIKQWSRAWNCSKSHCACRAWHLNRYLSWWLAILLNVIITQGKYRRTWLLLGCHNGHNCESLLPSTRWPHISAAVVIMHWQAFRTPYSAKLCASFERAEARVPGTSCEFCYCLVRTFLLGKLARISFVSCVPQGSSYWWAIPDFNNFS